MTETGAEIINEQLPAELEPPSAETRRAVELCIAQLRRDPRTVDCVAAVDRLLPALAAANGIDTATFPVWDIFQAVTDAWQSATVRAYHEGLGSDPFDESTRPAE